MLSVDFLRGLNKETSSYLPANHAPATEESVNRLSGLLDALVGTAGLINITASHRAGACNPLCTLLERCQASSDESIRSLIWARRIWSDLFDIFLERSDNAKPKSMRQVLISLCSILQKDKSSSAQAVRDEAVVQLFGILFQEDNNAKVKPALTAISYFVQKEVISLEGLIRRFENWYPVQGKSPQQFLGPENATKVFLYGLMNWVSYQDTTPAAGNTICTILDYGRRQNVGHVKSGDTSALPIWVEPLERSIRRNPDALHNFRSHVFPDLFKPVVFDYIRFLEYLHLDDHIRLRPSSANALSPSDDLEASLLFTTLQVGKDMGFVQEVDYRSSQRVEIRDGVVSIPDKLLGRLLVHERADTRLAAFSLLTVSAAVTRPLTVGTFVALKRNLAHLHAHTDANFRGEIMSLTLQLFDRLRASTHMLSKSLAREQKGVLAHDSAKFPPPGERFNAPSLFGAHVDFIKWFLHFLSSELHPNAAYQRHISALKSLTIVIKSGLDPSVPHNALSRTAQGEIKWPFQVNILTPPLVRELFDLIMDPFDDVRHAAVCLLKLGSLMRSEPATGQLKSSTYLPENHVDPADLIEQGFDSFLDRAEKTMLQSGRADHADGVARAYDLLFEKRAEKFCPASPANEVLAEWMKSRRGIVEHLIHLLDETISAASQNLSIAVNAYSMHGTLSALRYIIDQPTFYSSMAGMEAGEVEHWKFLHSHILSSLRTIWTCVRGVLCNDAPEGHVPDDMEDEPDLTTKDILSYSWRALKEASTLLRVIVAKAPFQLPNGIAILETSEFKDLGNLCFIELAELRHRGAFSTVAQTFAACCLRCSRSQNPEIRCLLDRWYEETLRCMQDKGSMITRRSAGLPSLITGILTATPDGQLFERVMNDLKSEAIQKGQDANIDGSHLPQVHALNCLKEIFTNTKLALPSEPYMAEVLSLAVSRLELNVWAIRNCGLMLFRALIDRLLGSGTTQNWKEADHLKITRLSYERFPNLLDIIIQLLRPRRYIADSNDAAVPELANTALEGVFPALQILQRARPAAERRPEIQQLVFNLTGSSHWHVRDMAARTLAALLEPEERVEWVLALIELPCAKQNALHGLLLSIKYLVKELCGDKVHDNTDDLELLCFALSRQFTRLFKHNLCPLTKAAYLDILNQIGKHAISKKYPMDSFYDNLPELTAEAMCVLGDYRMDFKVTNSGRSAGSSLLRKDLVIYMVSQFVLKVLTAPDESPLSQHLVEYVSTVVSCDPDTCCISAEHLTSISFPSLAGVSEHTQKSLGFFLGLTNRWGDSDLVTAIRRMVIEFLHQGLPVLATKSGSKMLDLKTGRNGLGSPSLHEVSVRLRGSFFDHRLHEGEDIEGLAKEMQLYVNTIHSDLEEDNPFPTRYAAISAASALEHIWICSWRNTALESVVLDLCLATYDALNDDEDEIRDVAARITTRIIAGPRYRPGAKSAVPLAASQKLAQHLTAQYPVSQTLCRAGMNRMLDRDSGKEPGTPLTLSRSVGDLLAAARQGPTALFAREKQNLFIDPVREAGIWSTALSSLSPAAIPRPLAHQLTIFVIEGLAVLTSMAQSERDGALGWASKPEVFQLGARIVCAARVLLAWRAKVPRKVGVKSSEIRRRLREFCDVAAARSVHGLLVRWAEDVLAESVVAKLRAVRAVMGEVVGGEEVLG